MDSNCDIEKIHLQLGKRSKRMYYDMARSIKKHDDNDQFMDYVQMHERLWGTDTYTGKPDLQEILEAPIVVFWKQTKRKEQLYTVTLHEDMREIELMFFKMLFRLSVNTSKVKRPMRVFQNQVRMRIKNVRVDFVPDED